MWLEWCTRRPMKISQNRWVSFYFFVLAALPIAMVIVFLQYQDFSSILSSRYISRFSFELVVLAGFALVLSALCFPDRPQSRRMRLGLLIASLLLTLMWTVVAPGVPTLLCLIPSWFLWRLHRRDTQADSNA